MTLGFAPKLGFILGSTIVDAYNIDGSLLKTYNIVLAEFLLHNSFENVRFFEETFLLADTSTEVVLGMFFLFFSNTNFEISASKFT